MRNMGIDHKQITATNACDAFILYRAAMNATGFANADCHRRFLATFPRLWYLRGSWRSSPMLKELKIWLRSPIRVNLLMDDIGGEVRSVPQL